MCSELSHQPSSWAHFFFHFISFISDFLLHFHFTLLHNLLSYSPHICSFPFHFKNRRIRSSCKAEENPTCSPLLTKETRDLHQRGLLYHQWAVTPLDQVCRTSPMWSLSLPPSPFSMAIVTFVDGDVDMLWVFGDGYVDFWFFIKLMIFYFFFWRCCWTLILKIQRGSY